MLIKRSVGLSVLLLAFLGGIAQNATIKEYLRDFPTYPFSDPDPIPEMGTIYPYYRFDGFTSASASKKWKVVELENDYIKVMVMPEIGGKIWSAIEKSTGKSFIYYNKTVKFRDIAMRGPWTSGGIEPNYGIIGHTPNCATPMDYTMISRPDGSVSCIVGTLDLLTRTSWHIDINLAKDKAYFTTSSFWYNSSSFEQPYYTWMNAAIRAGNDLQFIYPGTKYIGHVGEYSNWPINEENGKDISWYKNNDFEGAKSYHVLGKYSNFFGAYWHNEDFGMGRYSAHDEKVGKKLFIWGLSEQGMIWEKMLTDTDGQYVEVQSGRLFNQASPGSGLTPFKNKGFLPHVTDVWTEYWFPVVNTKGMVEANDYGVLNMIAGKNSLNIFFSPLQKINDELVISSGGKILYSRLLSLNALQVFTDSLKIDAENKEIVVTLGNNRLRHEWSSTAGILSRPIETPKDFDWSSAYGYYLKGRDNIRERRYQPAEENLRRCLSMEPYYLPALTDLSLVLYHNMKYTEALGFAKAALSVDTYDPQANYYYGLINARLGNMTDAKDGLDMASSGAEYRSAAYTELALIYLKEGNLAKTSAYAQKSINFNRYAIGAYKALAVCYRLQKNNVQAGKILDTIRQYDPLDHFSGFEKYLMEPSEENLAQFVGSVRNEMPSETFLELCAWYYSIGQDQEAKKVLQQAPLTTEIVCWLAFLEDKPLNNKMVLSDMIFPFRAETEEILRQLMAKNEDWPIKYQLALIKWNNNDPEQARLLFDACGSRPEYAPFYAARAKFNIAYDTAKVLDDLLKAKSLDASQWRHWKNIANYYLAHRQYSEALTFAKEFNSRFPSSYLVNMIYVKVLILNRQFEAANAILKKIHILPYEGATEGRQLYKETNLMLALDRMKKKKYSQSLAYIAAARLWPANLGVGKPYDEDVDSRLEDLLLYENYNRQGNKAGATMALDKILGFKKQTGEGVSQANHLVTAWAMQKTGQHEKALQVLQDRAAKDPADGIAGWALSAYSNGADGPQDIARADENYRVLNELLRLRAEEKIP